MKIQDLDIVGWEPCVLRFFFEQRSECLVSEFRRHVQGWLEAGGERNCGCHFRYVEFQEDVPADSVRVDTEWMCRVCAQALVDDLHRAFSELKLVTLGFADPGPPERNLWLDIPGRIVELEDGGQHRTEGFSIRKRPVTIAEFEEFVRSTGYATLAEKCASAENFRSHFGLEGLGARSRSSAPVEFVAPLDAEAFCNFYGFRLPTEAEWFAAAVLDPVEREISTLEELQLLSRMPTENCLELHGWDITSTTLSSGLVIARRGPAYFLKRDWREADTLTLNRRTIKPESFDMSITFRVVALPKEDLA